MRFTLKVEWQRDNGSTSCVELGTVECGPCRSASDVGLTWTDAKPILRRLQEVVIAEQLKSHCQAARWCPGCRRQRPFKDVRKRHFHTTLGAIEFASPRFRGCRDCGEPPTVAPLSALLPERTSPELVHLQAKLATQLPYRQAAALLQE